MNNSTNINRLLDVEMNVTVRFGKTEMPLKEVVHFGIGSMLELNRTVDEPVELLVNNYPFARGEVVVVDGYYGVRVTEIGSADERSNTLFPGHGNRSDEDSPARAIADFGAALAAEPADATDPVAAAAFDAAEESPAAEEVAETEEIDAPADINAGENLEEEEV